MQSFFKEPRKDVEKWIKFLKESSTLFRAPPGWFYIVELEIMNKTIISRTMEFRMRVV